MCIEDVKLNACNNQTKLISRLQLHESKKKHNIEIVHKKNEQCIHGYSAQFL